MLFSAALIAAQMVASPLPAIANPASTYCIAVGGRLEFQATARGTIGICVLPNGRRIEEWTLYRRALRKAQREKGR